MHVENVPVRLRHDIDLEPSLMMMTMMHTGPTCRQMIKRTELYDMAPFLPEGEAAVRPPASFQPPQCADVM